MEACTVDSFERIRLKMACYQICSNVKTKVTSLLSSPVGPGPWSDKAAEPSLKNGSNNDRYCLGSFESKARVFLRLPSPGLVKVPHTSCEKIKYIWNAKSLKNLDKNKPEEEECCNANFKITVRNFRYFWRFSAELGSMRQWKRRMYVKFRV